MFGLGIGEILVILVIALIFVGPKKLPGLAKGLGKGMREFQNAMRGISSTIQNPLDHEYLKPDEQERKPLDQVDLSEFKDDPPHDQNKPSDETHHEKLAKESNKSE